MYDKPEYFPPVLVFNSLWRRKQELGPLTAHC
jgi:hypothetical protein